MASIRGGMRPTAALTGLLIAVAMAGCGELVTGLDESVNRVSLSVATAGAASASTAAVATRRSVTQTDGQGTTLEITRVAFVLSEIELEADDFECPDDTAAGEDDDCEELERGPILVDFEPGETTIVRDIAVTEVPSRLQGATFTEVEFELDVPDDDGGEGADALLGPGVSVRVEGCYDAESCDPASPGFTFTSDVEAEQEREVTVEIMGSDNPDTNVTLQVDIDSWFRDGSGTLIDPATAADGGANESLVEENIEASFDAFEDEDEDGVDETEDDDEDEMGDDADDDGGSNEG